ncbi:MAG: stage V sporulation protein AE [Defluviitaleaceae bacterium]|nr:stage V sporulation protein AE [Defluviitaleaceae bacterium]
MQYLWAFLVGGAICVIGQLLIDKTKLTSARILVFFVVAGVILGGVGVYQHLVDFAGAGASVPITGFGNLLAKGVKEEIDRAGVIGILTGGLKATAAGIMAAVVLSFAAALIFQPKSK